MTVSGGTTTHGIPKFADADVPDLAAGGLGSILDTLDSLVGAYKLAQFLGAGASADFTSIPQNFRHLMLTGRADIAAGTFWSGLLRFNNDSGANYSVQDLVGNATSIAASESLNGTTAAFVSSNHADGPAIFAMFIPDYSLASGNAVASPHKFICMYLGANGVLGATAGLLIEIIGGGWASPAATAINRLTLFPGSSSWAGAAFSLYGLN